VELGGSGCPPAAATRVTGVAGVVEDFACGRCDCEWEWE
jgi:hypothetical protein